MGQLIVSVVMASVTVLLLVVTWKYARSTESIATETKNAARAARDAAEISLLQSLMNVQPLLEVQSVNVDYFPPEKLDPGREIMVPVRIKWRIANLGRGIAFSPTFSARVADVEIDLSDDTVVPIHLDAAQELLVTHQLDSRAKDLIVESLKARPTDALAMLLLTCRDAFGSLIESPVSLDLDRNEARFSHGNRVYAGGPEPGTRLRILVTRMLANIPDSA